VTYIRERPRLRQAILSFCKKKNISVLDMFVDFPVSDSIRKQLKKMLLETDQLDIAKQLKSEKK
jgi:hypothetical protein